MVILCCFRSLACVLTQIEAKNGKRTSLARHRFTVFGAERSYWASFVDSAPRSTFVPHLCQAAAHISDKNRDYKRYTNARNGST